MNLKPDLRTERFIFLLENDDQEYPTEMNWNGWKLVVQITKGSMSFWDYLFLINIHRGVHASVRWLVEHFLLLFCYRHFSVFFLLCLFSFVDCLNIDKWTKKICFFVFCFFFYKWRKRKTEAKFNLLVHTIRLGNKTKQDWLMLMCFYYYCECNKVLEETTDLKYQNVVYSMHGLFYFIYLFKHTSRQYHAFSDNRFSAFEENSATSSTLFLCIAVVIIAMVATSIL